MSDKKDVVFFVADAAMEAVFREFLKRGHFAGRLHCADFSFDIARDPPSKDGGVYKRVHELLKSFQHTHERTVVVLDKQFGNEGLKTDQVKSAIEENLRDSGWDDDHYAVVVIDPELEVWLWQDNAHVEQCLKYQGAKSLRATLADSGEWPVDCLKPLQPKDCIQQLIRRNRAGVPTVVYTQIAAKVSVLACQDAMFQALLAQLQTWFPLSYSPAPEVASRPQRPRQNISL